MPPTFDPRHEDGQLKDPRILDNLPAWREFGLDLLQDPAELMRWIQHLYGQYMGLLTLHILNGNTEVAEWATRGKITLNASDTGLSMFLEIEMSADGFFITDESIESMQRFLEDARNGIRGRQKDWRHDAN